MIEIKEKNVEGARWFEAWGNNTIIGFAVASIEGSHVLRLDIIHVIPGFRRKGVASRLLEAMYIWGKKNDANEIMGEFRPEYRGCKEEGYARNFYRKHGIEITQCGMLNGKI